MEKGGVCLGVVDWPISGKARQARGGNTPQAACVGVGVDVGRSAGCKMGEPSLPISTLFCLFCTARGKRTRRCGCNDHDSGPSL